MVAWRWPRDSCNKRLGDSYRDVYTNQADRPSRNNKFRNVTNRSEFLVPPSSPRGFGQVAPATHSTMHATGRLRTHSHAHPNSKPSPRRPSNGHHCVLQSAGPTQSSARAGRTAGWPALHAVTAVPAVSSATITVTTAAPAVRAKSAVGPELHDVTALPRPLRPPRAHSDRRVRRAVLAATTVTAMHAVTLQQSTLIKTAKFDWLSTSTDSMPVGLGKWTSV